MCFALGRVIVNVSAGVFRRQSKTQLPTPAFWVELLESTNPQPGNIWRKGSWKRVLLVLVPSKAGLESGFHIKTGGPQLHLRNPAQFWKLQKARAAKNAVCCSGTGPGGEPAVRHGIPVACRASSSPGSPPPRLYHCTWACPPLPHPCPQSPPRSDKQIAGRTSRACKMASLAKASWT